MSRSPRKPPFEILLPGDAPLVPVIVHVPHASRCLPDLTGCDLMLTRHQLRRELSVMTDHHTDLLAEAALAQGAVVFVNRVSRLLVDPERFADDRLESAAAHGMGAVYTRTHDGRPLRYPDFGTGQRRQLMDRFYHPYHAAFTRLVDRFLAEFGAAFIIDLHSYPDRPLPFQEPGPARPEVCLGFEEFHRPEDWTRWWAEHPSALEIAHNKPFAGSFVPAAHHRSDRRVRSLMVELNRRTYLDQGTDNLRKRSATISALKAFFRFACGDAADIVRPPALGVSRRQARQIARDFLRNRGTSVNPRIWKVEHPDDLPRRGPAPFLLYDVKPEVQLRSWVAYIQSPTPGALRSSLIVLVDRQTGQVVYSGDANDEG